MKKIINIFTTYFLPVVVVGVVVVICVIFLLENLPYDNNSIETSFDKNKVVVSNKYTMSDELGKNITLENQINGTTGYVEFEIKSKVDGKLKYEVILIKEASDEEIDSKYIKVYLTDEKDFALENYNGARVPTFYDLRVSESDPSGRVIYSGSFKNKESKKFKLRVWTSDTHEIVAENKIFSVKLKVNVK